MTGQDGNHVPPKFSTCAVKQDYILYIYIDHRWTGEPDSYLALIKALKNEESKRKGVVMKKVLIIVVVCSLLALCGCIPISLYPLYSESDLISEPDLVGTWAEKDGDEEIVFEQAGEKAYIMTNNYKGIVSEFDVRLLRLGEDMFMDLYPRDPGVKLNDIYQEHIVGVHSFYHIHQIKPVLRMSTFDYEWLKKQLTENQQELPHAILDGKLVITAPTAALQAFVLKNFKSEGAIIETTEFHRVEKR